MYGKPKPVQVNDIPADTATSSEVSKMLQAVNTMDQNTLLVN